MYNKTVKLNFNVFFRKIGISIQAMDFSHVALVCLNLSMEGFETYRCDSNIVLGVNIQNLAKVMKLADPSDSVTL